MDDPFIDLMAAIMEARDAVEAAEHIERAVRSGRFTDHEIRLAREHRYDIHIADD